VAQSVNPAARIHTVNVGKKILMPPRRAVVFLCHLLSFGIATLPYVIANFLTRGGNINEMAKLAPRTDI
jgi:Na+(H+)/acetate symporter ActP